MNEQELMQKLALSKAIMNKTESIKRGSVTETMSPSIGVEDFPVSDIKYNIPQELLENTHIPTPQSNPAKPLGVPTVEAIKNSKLPDEIKKLMIEHPISQPSMATNPTLSDELVEKATRLMKTNEVYTANSSSKKQNVVENTSSIDYNKIQKMIENAVNKALKENGMIAESTEKTNEVFSFRVGKHIFEGKLTKIKKTS